MIDSKFGAGIPWNGPAKVNGRLWPVANPDTLWLPPGPVAVEPSTAVPPMRILDFNGDLKTASAQANSVEVSYNSAHRAIAILDRQPGAVEIDGAPVQADWLTVNGRHTILLPKGQHVVTFLLTAAPLPKEVPSSATSAAAMPRSTLRNPRPLP